MDDYPPGNSPEFNERSEVHRKRIEAAVSEAIRELRGGMVTKFYTVFEFIDEDGDRDIGSYSTAGLMKWDVMGLVEYMMSGNLVSRIVATLREDE